MNDTELESHVANLEAEFVTDPERYEAGDYTNLTDVVDLPDYLDPIVEPPSAVITDVGLGHLALGNCALGRAWLATAVSGYIERFESGLDIAARLEKSVSARSFADLRFALLNALVAGDEEPLQELLTGVNERLEDVPPDRQEDQQHWAATCETIVALLIDGDPETAVTRLRQLADDGPGEWSRARASTLEGIVYEDAEKVRDGIEAILPYHRETVVANAGYSLPRRHVCHDAWGFLTLAHRQGLDVEIESEYVPACIITAGDRTAD